MPVNLSPFTGPGSTRARRRFWSDVVSAVKAAQKIAGRNVTVDVHPGKGSVINVERPSAPSGPTGACCIDGECSITTESECVAGGGIFLGVGTTCDPNPCPGVECDCPVACGLCFAVKLEAGDDFDGSMSELTDNSTTFIDTWIEGTGPWIFQPAGISVGVLYGIWHSVQLQFVKIDASHVRIFMTVDGSTASFDIASSATSLDTLLIGNVFGASGGVNRQFRCVKLSGTGEFTFPPDSFDSFTGSASVVDDVLVCTGTGDSYASKTISPGFDPHCCDEYTLALDASSSGTVVAGGDCGGGGFNVDLTASGSGFCPTTCTLECSTDFTSCCGTTCEGECGPFDAGVIFRARLTLGGGDYTLHLDASFQDAGCLTVETFGGDDIHTDNLGPDPTGTFNYSFDDPNNASVHYEFTVTVFPP